jgi:hypothetical protein
MRGDEVALDQRLPRMSMGAEVAFIVTATSSSSS